MLCACVYVFPRVRWWWRFLVFHETLQRRVCGWPFAYFTTKIASTSVVTLGGYRRRSLPLLLSTGRFTLFLLSSPILHLYTDLHRTNICHNSSKYILRAINNALPVIETRGKSLIRAGLLSRVTFHVQAIITQIYITMSALFSSQSVELPPFSDGFLKFLWFFRIFSN